MVLCLIQVVSLIIVKAVVKHDVCRGLLRRIFILTSQLVTHKWSIALEFSPEVEVVDGLEAADLVALILGHVAGVLSQELVGRHWVLGPLLLLLMLELHHGLSSLLRLEVPLLKRILANAHDADALLGALGVRVHVLSTAHASATGLSAVLVSR